MKRQWFLPLVTMLALPLMFVLSTTGQSTFGTANEAPTGFDNKTNGLVDQATHDENRLEFFSEVDGVDEGLIVLSVGACRDSERLAVRLRLEGRRTHIGHPNLNWAQTLRSQTQTMFLPPPGGMSFLSHDIRFGV